MIVVVSEERLKKAEIEAYEKELEKELDALTEPQSLEEALLGE